ncbi:hypothetical protein [Empedobacter sp.]|uniref:hypothetical protein n=1 Tax=Empedobacter sp. TaxID=1927715 RepID=UPI000E820D15|nr:hypothetical protein [Empedobacter sp.]HBX62356.1 hypothetical protein [Flavobacteriaceae bacterium]
MKNLTLLLFCSFIIFQSCGEDKKPRTKDGQTISNVSNDKDRITNSNTGLVLTINADFNKSDELIVFWKDKSIGWFTEEKTIYAGSSDVEGHQNIEFKFPENVTPTDLRLDISSNKDQKEIKINFIKIADQGREFYIFGDELTKYFQPNEFINYNDSNNKLSLSSKGENYDPFLTTTHNFILELQKVLNTAF